ncbi:branched-chain amino acid ABC transporter permease [Vibrio viridaestus]|uniref:Branched-chain amino acid ABC transporter permease n=1 Tax=Vibrio viridaestus TaxID=2487322 RepID=A0A3N9TWS7_9VIBR|nr:branched-chain amino acid ABC transporter permease [Vibrio viridaestus]RQW61372.1 branched-chain amino acid ABC transporter permease [Vibrio viridaestus]
MFEFLLHVIIMTGIYGLVALALNIQAGWTGLLNFGHIAFVGIGAYAIGMGMMWDIPLLFSVLAGLVIAATLALAIGMLGRKLAADYWGIATLAVAEIIRMIAFNEDDLTGGAQGISHIVIRGFNDTAGSSYIFFVITAVLLCITALLCRQVYISKFGRALRLIREEPQLAMCLGYHVLSIKCQALVLSSIIGALAGMILALYMNYVSPDYLLSSETFVIWSMVIIGGIGRVSGVLVGSLIIELLYNFIPFAKDIFNISADTSGAIRLGLIGFILLLCLLKKSDGLIPEQVREIR